MTTVWSGLEVKACRLHLGQSWWRKMQSSELSKQHGKKDSEVSQFLKPATALFGIFIQSSERQESGTVLRLPTRKLY